MKKHSLKVGVLVVFFLCLGLVFLVLDPWKLTHRIIKHTTRLLGPEITPNKELYQFDSKLGWVARPTGEIHLKSTHIYRVKIGEDGFRGDKALLDAEVLVLGDSFSFGIGIDEDKHFQNIDPSLNIKAIGLPGYNLVQEFLLLKKYSDKLESKLVVWLIFYGNDFYESVQENMMQYRTPYLKEFQGEWRIMSEHLKNEPFNYDLKKHKFNYLGNLGLVCSPDHKLNEKMYAAAAYILSEGKKLCQAAGANLVLLGLPCHTQFRTDARAYLKEQRDRLFGESEHILDTAYPDEQLNIISDRFEIPFYTMYELFQIEDYSDDLHWEESGHQKVTALLERIKAKYLLK